MSEVGLSVMRFDGDDLEVVELDGAGWVSLPSLLRPFGKRVDATQGLLAGWAITRVFRDPSRMGPGNLPGIDTTLIRVEDAPLLVARLDGRGMSDEVKAKHARYLQRVARALAEHFGLRPKAAAPLDPWTVLQASARATLELRGRVETVEQRLEATHKLAEQAVRLAGSKSVMDAVVDATPPGRATETPDGAFVRRARDGYRSMRGVARRFGLPRVAQGAMLVARVTEALGLAARADLFDHQDVVIGGLTKNDHRLYGPQVISILERPLRAAYGAMIELGYAVTEGGAMVARRSPVRSKSWVVQRMFDAALEVGAPPKDPPAEPTPLAGGDQQDLFNKAS